MKEFSEHRVYVDEFTKKMARGRPSTPRLIVPENEILSRDAMFEERWNMIALRKGGDNILR